MKALALLCFICIVSTVNAQENLLTWQENTPLKWKDFSGPALDDSHFDAETFGDVKYTYTFKSLNDFEFDVQATFNRAASWIKKQSQSKSLLKHEQVHFDIAQLYACKLKKAFTSFNYTSNFKEEIVQIAEAVSKEYHSMQEQYDEETNHSTVAPQQKRWEMMVKEALKAHSSFSSVQKADALKQRHGAVGN